ncbi:hypothetical protein M422DRAFT_264393 [Sphaerobolus stellatus SS14]|uniref:Uncharacterized protein n=1 Tax=Sphaerobolus stellatus (strain SS14) TaxID=990650 RepID=A0A0C9V8H9_SPHS4|nr:hypothetical protein M422DRAFT_264393 [Sphaerobolus stellatus SS14]
MELKNIIIEKTFLSFAVALPEGTQMALPVLRNIIFHELATLDPAFHHHEAHGLDLPDRRETPDSPTLYVVPKRLRGGKKLERAPLADYLAIKSQAQIINAGGNKRNWEELLRRCLTWSHVLEGLPLLSCSRLG